MADGETLNGCAPTVEPILVFPSGPKDLGGLSDASLRELISASQKILAERSSAAAAAPVYLPSSFSWLPALLSSLSSAPDPKYVAFSFSPHTSKFTLSIEGNQKASADPLSLKPEMPGHPWVKGGGSE